ncbi:MAG: accessory gene regulator B family protein [Lachnospiraceae bacterium]|nr:accessory gene regulator B family protein [Lachnospiraceae bacterium]
MSIRLAHFLADFFATRRWIDEDAKIVYVVGLDVLFTTALDWTVVGMLGLIRGRFLETVVYLLFFMTVRRYSGGYHASTRIGCLAIFVGFYLLADIVMMAIYKSGGEWFRLVFSVSSMVAGELVFYSLTPIANDRKRYTHEELNGVKKKAFICLNIWYCLALLMVAFGLELSGQIVVASNIVVLLIMMTKEGSEEMNCVLKAVLNSIFTVGMSTTNAISRFDAYEPEEDVQLAKWVEQKRRAENEEK